MSHGNNGHDHNYNNGHDNHDGCHGCHNYHHKCEKTLKKSSDFDGFVAKLNEELQVNIDFDVNSEGQYCLHRDNHDRHRNCAKAEWLVNKHPTAFPGDECKSISLTAAEKADESVKGFLKFYKVPVNGDSIKVCGLCDVDELLKELTLGDTLPRLAAATERTATASEKSASELSEVNAHLHSIESILTHNGDEGMCLIGQDKDL